MPSQSVTNGAGRRDNASFARSQIRQMIRSGDLAEGGKLPTERALCDRLGVSRRAVRRALDVLETEGLVWRRQGKGTFVGERPDPNGKLAALLAPDTDPLSVMEARLALEPELAALAARRATAEDVTQMRELAARVAQTSDSDEAELWDGSLHRLIARIAGNALLRTAFTMINDVRAEHRWQQERHQARRPGGLVEYNRQHEAIIAAIDARNEAGARAAMRAHLSSVLENLQRSRATQPGPMDGPEPMQRPRNTVLNT